MITLALAFAGAIAQCAPNVGPRTMAAIVRVESGGDSLAVGDNTTGRSYHLRDRSTAEALAQNLIEVGHSVDLGLAQIDSANLQRLGLGVNGVFDACANLRAGARILSEDYSVASNRFGPGQNALRHAIGMYNTGLLDAGDAYVRRVLVAAKVPLTGLARTRHHAPPIATRHPSESLARRTKAEKVHTRTMPSRPATAPILVVIPPVSTTLLF